MSPLFPQLKKILPWLYARFPYTHVSIISFNLSIDLINFQLPLSPSLPWDFTYTIALVCFGLQVMENSNEIDKQLEELFQSPMNWKVTEKVQTEHRIQARPGLPPHVMLPGHSFLATKSSFFPFHGFASLQQTSLLEVPCNCARSWKEKSVTRIFRKMLWSLLWLNPWNKLFLGRLMWNACETAKWIY